ncbi:MAG: phosphoribosylglycinamide formyltransferase [Bacteroidales bacterium]|nr:phosphoribosylglycinamide formyltransferase [Bacteroidales bacterium]
MKRLAIFASGNGSNAENIIRYFKNNPAISIDLILTNNSKAKVIQRAEKLGVLSLVFSKEDFYSSDSILLELQNRSIDLIILAGFMWLVPANLITYYSGRIINIHPALLPMYGGKGMYGDYVHEAVSSAGDLQTGITIHFVNENYDEGAVIFQKKVNIEAGEDPILIADKVHDLEHEFFPQVIAQVLK